MTTTTSIPRTHNGRPIVGQKIEIRKTGGEFSTDLLVANPELLDGVKQGHELTIAVRVACIDEHFPSEDRTKPADGGVFHKLIFDPVEVTIVDDDVVAASFDAQRERVSRAKDTEAGQRRLPTDEELHDAHTAGEHASGLVEGCIECDREAELEAAEKKTPAKRTRTRK